MSHAVKMTDHEEIRDWVEARDGRPAVVEDTAEDGQGVGVLRIDFDQDDDRLKPVSWETFFDTFEKKKLALLAQYTVDGQTSRFFKFVER